MKGRGLASRVWVRHEGWLAPTFCAAIALLAVHGAFSSSRVFYLRDLSFLYWPLHLWLRDTLLAGNLPLWDPYVAFGQSAIADPARHALFPPTLAARLLLPRVLGFNMAVAVAFPVAAVGMYLFLRRGASVAAAALGSCLFALSGPVLSTGNMVNLSWSVALMPWVAWAADRVSELASARRVAVLAIVVALQLLAGEPVTLAAMAALVVAYAALVPDERWVARLRSAAWVAAGLAAGVLLSAVQLFPLAEATAHSVRSSGYAAGVARVWEVHPLSLVEALVPGLLGDAWEWGQVSHMWLDATNGGREPFLLSVYVGVAWIGIAACGALGSSRRRQAIFWAVIFVTSVVLALGYYTPVLPALRELVPPLRSFRIPAKYLVVSAFALAALAALGWDAIAAAREAGRDGGRLGLTAATFMAGAVALAAAGGLLFAAVAPHALLDGATRLASTIGIENTESAGRHLAEAFPVAALRLAALAAATAGALWTHAARRREAPLAAAVLFGMAVLDPLVVNARVNPTTAIDHLERPDWLSLPSNTDARVYVGGRLAWAVHGDSGDIDNPPPTTDTSVRPHTFQEQLAINSTRLATCPSGWAIRDSVSIDNNALWPREYVEMLKRLKRADRAERTRFLTRAGVRYFVTPEPPSPTSTRLGQLPELGIAVYEEAAAPRAFVVPSASVEPDPVRAVEHLFSPDFDPKALAVVDADAPAAGVHGPPVEPTATITLDLPSETELRASVAEGGGYLVLLDSYSPAWHAEVDGAEAPLLRGNGLFRAVRLAPGSHVVRLVFRPTLFYAGATVSTVIALLLLWLALRPETHYRNMASDVQFPTSLE